MKPGKIIIVDEDVEFLAELKHSLVSRGCEVIALSGAADAVERALEIMPDAVVVEFSLSRGGGIRVAEKLSQRAQTREIPVVYLTSFYSVLTGHPDLKICFKSHFNPGKIVEDIIKHIEGY
jgi:ActR/RegA family two-component response regulator